MSILVVQQDQNNLRAAVMDQGKLYAYGEERKSVAIAEEQIYLAVVDRAIKGVSAVFVRLPNKEFGFLPIPAGAKAPASGDRILVQVKRPPNAQKKAMVSRDITLAGTHIVYLPFSNFFRVSAKTEDAQEKAQLKAMAKQLMPEKGGIILRSSALSCDLEALDSELALLMKNWQQIAKSVSSSPAPSLIWQGEDLLSGMLRDEGERLEYVLTNDESALPKDLDLPIRHADEPFLLHTVDHKLEKSLRRTVLLKSGATLVFDVCEAMTVIDVNSGMAAGGRDITVTAEKINTEAAAEIARLLRLRGIGGIVMIDFIDMSSDEARERILITLREHFKNDPMKITVYGFTQLGLVEMTRRRAATPLSPLPDLPCPHCGGSGADLSFEEDLSDA